MVINWDRLNEENSASVIKFTEKRWKRAYEKWTLSAVDRWFYNNGQDNFSTHENNGFE